MPLKLLLPVLVLGFRQRSLSCGYGVGPTAGGGRSEPEVAVADSPCT